MRLAFNNHSISATYQEKLDKAIRRFLAHKLAYIAVHLDNWAWKLDFDTEFNVYMDNQDKRNH